MFEKAQNVIVLSPTSEVLTLGVGSASTAFLFPNKIAYLRYDANQSDSKIKEVDSDAVDDRRRLIARQQITSELKLPSDQIPVLVQEEEGESIFMEVDSNAKVLLGDELSSLKDLKEYKIVTPLLISGLDRTRSETQLRHDLGLIWSTAIQRCLEITRSELCNSGVVLLIPESLDLRDMELMMDTVLIGLGFKEAVIHAACTAALFGQGISSGCVVNLESDSIRVVCIEDGVVISKSSQFLSFGGRQITESLSCFLQESGIFLSCSWETPFGQQVLDRVKDEGCFLPTEDSEEAMESHLKTGSLVKLQGVSSDPERTSWQEIRLGIGSCVPPMGLFYPQLFPEADPVPLTHVWSHSEAYYSGILDQQHNAKSKSTNRTLVEEFQSIGLDTAIVRSISAAEKVEQRRRLYTSILLVGPSSHLRGLTDMLERRVLSALPQEEVIDTVAVLESKFPSQDVIFKGGSVFGVLTPTEQWIQGKEWIDGVNLNKPGKYGKTDVLRSKAFWLIKTELGFD